MSAVVSDTSVIRAFSFLHQIELLQRLFDTIILPTAVANELAHPAGQFEPIIPSDPFFEVRAPANHWLVENLLSALDLGESEAIALAVEWKIDTILMDEAAGRRVAAQHHLRPMGVLGVLELAKADHLIAEARPMVDHLRRELSFRVSDDLYKTFVKRIGEE